MKRKQKQRTKKTGTLYDLLPKSKPYKYITKERLAGWTRRLEEEHSTPLLLIGIGHDEKAGQIVLCVPEGVEDDLIIGSLLYALRVSMRFTAS